MPKRTGPLALISTPAIALLFLSTLLHGATKGASDNSTVGRGTWGGQHMILEVSEKGAEIEFDCARGQLTQPIALNKNGDFDIMGTLTTEHGGPVRRDENTPPTPARYSGHVDGDKMSITVTLGEEKAGTFTLTRGASPNLTKCR